MTETRANFYSLRTKYILLCFSHIKAISRTRGHTGRRGYGLRYLKAAYAADEASLDRCVHAHAWVLHLPTTQAKPMICSVIPRV